MDTNGGERLKFTQMESQPYAFYEFFAWRNGSARLGFGLAMRLFKRHLREEGVGVLGVFLAMPK
jgi:hypothetical protein